MSILSLLESLASSAGVPFRRNSLRMACCAHGGQNPESLSLSASSDGVLLAYCHSNQCAFDEIVRSIRERYGVDFSSGAGDSDAAGDSSSPLEARYVYSRPGAPDIVQVELRYAGVCRRRNCRVPSRHKHCWREPRGIDNSGYPLLLHSPLEDVGFPPVIAEGEKTARACAEAGFPSYSYLGGTAGADKADYSALSGVPLVLVAPDNDRPGVRAARTAAARCLSAGAGDVRILNPVLLPGTKGSDLADLPVDRRTALLESLIAGNGILEPSVPRTSGPGPADSDSGSSGSGDSSGLVSYGVPYGPSDCTPLAAAMRFLSACDASIMLAFDHTDRASVYGTDGSGVWRERWGGLTQMLSSSAAEWFAEASRRFSSGNLSQSRFTQVARSVKEIQSPRGWNDVWAAAGTAYRELEKTGSVPEDITVCQEQDLDLDLRYLGAPNGVVDLETGELLTGLRARACLVTRWVPDAYRPDASHPLFDSLLSHLDEDQREWLLSAFGYALRGLPSRRLYIIQGAPGRGKTTLLNAMRSAIGDAATNGYGFGLSGQALTADRVSSPNSHSEHLAHFPLGRIATAADLPDRKLDTGLMKTLSGGDPLPVRRIRERSSRSRQATATLFISLNEGSLHNLDMADSALAGRIRLLEYPVLQAVQDPLVVDRVGKDPLVRQAVLAELVRRAASSSSPPEDIPTVAEARAAALDESLGDVGLFASRIVPGGPDLWLSCNVVWEEAIRESAASDGRPWGLSRSHLIRRVGLIRGLPAARVRTVGGRSERGWWGVEMEGLDPAG